MAHKMAKQKFLTKKYLNNKLANLLFEENDKRPNNKTNWGEYFREFYEHDFGLVYLDIVFEELEESIKNDFGIESDKSLFHNQALKIEEQAWDFDYNLTFKELIDIIYEDIQNAIKLPIKDKNYYFKTFKDNVIEPNSWNWIIYFPLFYLLLFIFLKVFVEAPTEALFNLIGVGNEIFKSIFGWILLFGYLYLLFVRNNKK